VDIPRFLVNFATILPQSPQICFVAYDFSVTIRHIFRFSHVLCSC